MAFAAGSTNKTMSKVFSNKTTGFGRTSTLTTLPRETSQPLLIEVLFFLALLETMRHLSPMQGEDFLNIPAGARNGVENGLELLLDVEAFE